MSVCFSIALRLPQISQDFIFWVNFTKLQLCAHKYQGTTTSGISFSKLKLTEASVSSNYNILHVGTYANLCGCHVNECQMLWDCETDCTSSCSSVYCVVILEVVVPLWLDANCFVFVILTTFFCLPHPHSKLHHFFVIESFTLVYREASIAVLCNFASCMFI